MRKIAIKTNGIYTRHIRLKNILHILCLTITATLLTESIHAKSELKPIELELTQVSEKSTPIPIKWSPRARAIRLEMLGKTDLAGLGHLKGELTVKDSKIPFVIARSKNGGCFDTLYIDSDNDGKVEDKAITVEPQLGEHFAWKTYFKIPAGSWKTWFEVPNLLYDVAKGEQHDTKNMPHLLHFFVRAKSEAPSYIHTRRTDLRIRTVDLGDAKNTILILQDLNMDGVYDGKDGWELVEEGKESKKSRRISDFFWVGGEAWKIEINDPYGKLVRLLPHDPGLTEAEDVSKRDRFREDEISAKADKPLAFRSDVAEAIADARKANKTYFLKFETDWCGPCKMMAKLVFPAKDVIAAAADVECIFVDGDQHKKLVKKYEVRGYPTGILFDGNGKQLKRYSGYRGVKEMTAFFSN